MARQDEENLFQNQEVDEVAEEKEDEEEEEEDDSSKDDEPPWGPDEDAL